MSSLSDFDFTLPAHLIAQRPTTRRTDSRLLVFQKDMPAPQHAHFKDIIDYLNPGDALVLNNTKVVPARFAGFKIPTGGKVEILLSRILPDGTWIVLIASKRILQINTELFIGHSQTLTAKILEKIEDEPGAYRMSFAENIIEHADKLGQIPLPPYIERTSDLEDKERYQTVFADPNQNQAVAAPSAGLHFDQNLLKKIEEKGIHLVYVTLHVGPGTFLPIRTDNLTEHKMHAEPWSVSKEAASTINTVKEKGGRIIAVGTTSVRVLESAGTKTKKLQAGSELTRLFIRPGFKFQIVDAFVTNFHVPKTTLLLLVAAAIGRERFLAAYKEAIHREYRFFSYGDACLFDVMDFAE
jgi:S-adenosylmethionine:tRNA ribosyltransferase-isomerase